jgi:hypothetical protein
MHRTKLAFSTAALSTLNALATATTRLWGTFSAAACADLAQYPAVLASWACESATQLTITAADIVAAQISVPIVPDLSQRYYFGQLTLTSERANHVWKFQHQVVPSITIIHGARKPKGYYDYRPKERRNRRQSNPQSTFSVSDYGKRSRRENHNKCDKRDRCREDETYSSHCRH